MGMGDGIGFHSLLKIGKQVDGKSEFAIQSMVVQCLHCLFGIFGIFIFQEAVALGVALLVHWIEDVCDFAAGRKQFMDDGFQFLLTRGVHFRDVVNNDDTLDAIRFAWTLFQYIAQQFCLQFTKTKNREKLGMGMRKWFDTGCTIHSSICIEFFFLFFL